jgi:hypothetical protein
MQSKPTDWSIWAIIIAWAVIMGGAIALNISGADFPMWGASVLSLICTVAIVAYRLRERLPELRRRINIR